jgi:hypothetical protein
MRSASRYAAGLSYRVRASSPTRYAPKLRLASPTQPKSRFAAVTDAELTSHTRSYARWSVSVFARLYRARTDNMRAEIANLADRIRAKVRPFLRCQTRTKPAFADVAGDRMCFEIGHYGRVLRYVLLRDALRNLSLEPSAGCRAVNHPGLTGSDPLQG